MRILIATILFFLSFCAQSQEYRRVIEASYAFGQTSVFQKGNLIGATGYEARHYDTFGVTYSRVLANTVSIYTGISWLTGKVENVSPIADGIVRETHSLSMLYLPVGIKFTFLKYLFVKGNAVVAFDTSKESPLSNQTGIGGGMAAGVQYVFKNRVGIYFSPYFNQHGIILFNREAMHERLMENGFLFGVSYHFR